MDVAPKPKRKPGRPRKESTTERPPGRGGGRLPKQWKDDAIAAGQKSLATARTKEETDLVKRMMKLTKGDGGTAFNAIKFLLIYRHDWEGKRLTVPAEPKPEKLGKKAQAMKDAENAGESTPWADLLH